MKDNICENSFISYVLHQVKTNYIHHALYVAQIHVGLVSRIYVLKYTMSYFKLLVLLGFVTDCYVIMAISIA